LGHALRKAVGVIARQQGRGLAEVAAQEAGAAVPMVDGTRSLKAALECDWDDPNERALALWRVIEALDSVEEYLDLHPKGDGEAAAEMGIARGVGEKDVKEAPGEVPELIRGWRQRGWCRWRIPRCATAERARASASAATSATSYATWTRVWYGRWE
jgi:hypothetical protein